MNKEGERESADWPSGCFHRPNRKSLKRVPTAFHRGCVTVNRPQTPGRGQRSRVKGSTCKGTSWSGEHTQNHQTRSFYWSWGYRRHKRGLTSLKRNRFGWQVMVNYDDAISHLYVMNRQTIYSQHPVSCFICILPWNKLGNEMDICLAYSNAYLKRKIHIIITATHPLSISWSFKNLDNVHACVFKTVGTRIDVILVAIIATL